MMRRAPLLLSLLAATFTLSGIAIQQAGAQKPSVAKSSKSGKVRLRNSPAGTAITDMNSGVSQITRDVVVTQDGEDFILELQKITYNENTNEAVGSGRLKIRSRDSTITGTTLRADFDAKVITIMGNVVMNSHGQGNGLKASNNIKRKPSKITCDRVDYNYENRQAVLTGNIRMEQDKNVGTCERIDYDEDRNYAKLKGTVLFTNAKGQAIRSSDVEVWIDEYIVKTQNRTVIESPDERKRTTRAVDPKQTVAAPPAIPNVEEFSRPLPPPPTPAPPAPEADETPAPATSQAPVVEKDKIG
jgi:lipopolysaccharide export system protein LptA